MESSCWVGYYGSTYYPWSVGSVHSYFKNEWRDQEKKKAWERVKRAWLVNIMDTEENWKVKYKAKERPPEKDFITNNVHKAEIIARIGIISSYRAV